MQETISVNQLTVCSTTYCIHWKAASFNRAHSLGRPKGRPGIFIVSDDSLYDRRAFSNSSRDSWKRLCIRRNSLECHRQGPTNKPHPVSCSFQSKKWTFDRLFARPYTHLQCRLPGLLIIYGDDVSRQKKNFFFSPDEEMMRAKHLSTATALRKKVKKSWRGFPSLFFFFGFAFYNNSRPKNGRGSILLLPKYTSSRWWQPRIYLPIRRRRVGFYF